MPACETITEVLHDELIFRSPPPAMTSISVLVLVLSRS